MYVFDYNGTAWNETAYVKSATASTEEQFGHVIALADDGTRMAVGTGTNGSSAETFVDGGSGWSHEASFNTHAGGSVALTADGSTLVIGDEIDDSSATGINGNESDTSATNSGAAHYYVFDGATWTRESYIKASNTEAGDGFGRLGVAVSDDGQTVAVGAMTEDSAATGIGGDQTDNNASTAGAVYLY